MTTYSIASASEKVIYVILVGPGLVGKELLNQIDKNFSSEAAIEVRIMGLANSQVMQFDSNGISLKNWKSKLTESKQAMSTQDFIHQMKALNLPHSVFVDCSSSQIIADTYRSPG